MQSKAVISQMGSKSVLLLCCIAGAIVFIMAVVPRLEYGEELATWKECTPQYGLAGSRADTMRIDASHAGPMGRDLCGVLRAQGGPIKPPPLTARAWLMIVVALFLFAGAFLLVRWLLLGGWLAAGQERQAHTIRREWREYVEREIPSVLKLPQGQRDRLLQLMAELMQSVVFEGCGGFLIDEDMCLTVASQAAFLALGRGSRCLGRVKRVLIYETGYEVPKTVWDALRWAHGSVVGEEPRRALGESWHDGVVVLAWDRVVEDLQAAHSGRNLVWHEFAHQVDQADGAADGVPSMLSWELVPGWRELMEKSIAQLRTARAGTPQVLRDYAAENEAEFFAVATEAFLDTPHHLQDAAPELYEALKAAYLIDPVAWWSPEDEAT